MGADKPLSPQEWMAIYHAFDNVQCVEARLRNELQNLRLQLNLLYPGMDAMMPQRSVEPPHESHQP